MGAIQLPMHPEDRNMDRIRSTIALGTGVIMIGMFMLTVTVVSGPIHYTY